eukprot:6456942-Amphidinium_carterae.4
MGEPHYLPLLQWPSTIGKSRAVKVLRLPDGSLWWEVRSIQFLSDFDVPRNQTYRFIQDRLPRWQSLCRECGWDCDLLESGKHAATIDAIPDQTYVSTRLLLHVLLELKHYKGQDRALESSAKALLPSVLLTVLHSTKGVGFAVRMHSATAAVAQQTFYVDVDKASINLQCLIALQEPFVRPLAALAVTIHAEVGASIAIAEFLSRVWVEKHLKHFRAPLLDGVARLVKNEFDADAFKHGPFKAGYVVPRGKKQDPVSQEALARGDIGSQHTQNSVHSAQVLSGLGLVQDDGHNMIKTISRSLMRYYQSMRSSFTSVSNLSIAFDGSRCGEANMTLVCVLGRSAGGVELCGWCPPQ